jgi:hypothetical protein
MSHLHGTLGPRGQFGRHTGRQETSMNQDLLELGTPTDADPIERDGFELG